MKRFFWTLVLPVVLILVVGGSVGAEPFGKKKRRPKPHEFGTVKLDNQSTSKGMAAVAFPHWLHRFRYTCRLCHVDLGFAMEANQTEITCEDLDNGLYCGACHDGKRAFGKKDQAGEEGAGHGPEQPVEHCDQCHSVGKKVKFENNFYTFKKGLPRGRLGNGIDWLKAEEAGLVTLEDFLEGVSIERKKLDYAKELEVLPKELQMPKILFSHVKHAVWSGCELCHPDIFGVERASMTYSMQEIFNGKYCGACHGKVAFPNEDCQRCHTEPTY